MKRHLIILLILFLTLPGMAQVAKVRPKHSGSNLHRNTTLTIFAPRHQTFWLYVDDVLQNKEPAHSVCIRNLWEDSFYIRVELNNDLQNCVGQYVDLRQSQALSIVQTGQCFGLEYSQAHIRPDLTMDLITNQGNPSGLPPGVFGMSPQDYDGAYQLISKESFDSSKLALAKQVVSANPMTASQILGICKLFSFESNKLEFAKYAYEFCVDRNKYFLLNEAFTYESSKRELNEYLQGR